MTVLPNASELSIQEAIKAGADAGQPYTHVHILAHGGEIAEDCWTGEQIRRAGLQ